MTLTFLNQLKSKAYFFILIGIVIVLLILSFSFNPGKTKLLLPSASPLVLPTSKPSINISTIKSESELVQREQEITRELYPLAKWMPKENETDTYSLIYSQPHTLEVTLKKGTREEALKQINDWIASKGINPASQQIIFK